MDQYIGKLLDNRYEILERIGTGGMAVVYKARCHRLNRLVAVKILRPELAQDTEFRRRFHEESQAVAMLSHPNIMAVYDVSHAEDLDYIVMELLDGITLKQYMQKKGLPLNWREALHFITQIMKALSHAHSRGIIHRDIKPQNIMVLRDGSVKVADFGIARVTSAARSTLTQEALGSVHYISPEQARGSRIDSRADIYSAGVVLYEMTAGRLPFEGDNPVSVAIQHINSIPLAPRDINPDIPEALEAINLKAMAPDAEKRYVSADAMLADLEEFRKNPSINFEYTQEELAQSETADEPTIVRPLDDSAGLRRRRDAESDNKNSRRRNLEDDRKSRRRRDIEDEEDDEMYDDRREGGGILPIVLAICAILIFFAGIAYFLWNAVFGGILADHTPEVTIPNFLGMTIEEIDQRIEQGYIDDVFVIVQGRTVSSDLPAGQIVRQSPSPNDLKKGDEILITVDVSAGPQELFMPNVVNEEWRQALAILKDELGLQYSYDYENSETVTRNYVIRSEPVAGTPLESGQKVKIIISLGPEKKMVPGIPNFVGKNIEEVQLLVEELNLTLVEVIEKSDALNAKGTVIFQSLPEGSVVEEGTGITFHISSGPTDDENPTGTPDDPNLPMIPGEDQPVLANTKTVSIPLWSYTEPVRIRILVGETVQFDSQVDPTAMDIYTKSITGTGQQQVVVYVNDAVISSYVENFDA